MSRRAFHNSTIALAAGIATVALAVLAWHRFAPVPGTDGSLSAPTSLPTGAQLYFGPRNSVAVLAFHPPEGQHTGAPEAYGFSVELARALRRATGLQVTARTSSFYFADGSAPPRLIGERLQVAHLLTGEFQLQGGRFSVNAHLTDTAQENEVWSQQFEGGLQDLFVVGDAIVKGVIDVVGPGGRSQGKRARSPVDPGAWVQYLRGLYFNEQLGRPDPPQAIAAFEQALELDPGLAPARVGIAKAWLSPGWPADGAGPELGKAREALQEALRADPDSAEALGLLSQLRHSVDWDWAGAAEAGRRAVEIDPTNAGLMTVLSQALFTLGEFKEARVMLEDSIARDPLNLASRLSLGLLQEFQGNYDEALTSYRLVLGLNPEYPGAHAYRARIKVIQGKADSALKESDEEVAPFWKDYSRVLASSASGQEEEASDLLGRLMEQHGQDAACQIAELLAFRGDIDGAFEWLRRAYRQHDAGMGEVKGNEFFAGLQDDPRWAQLLQDLHLPLD